MTPRKIKKKKPTPAQERAYSKGFAEGREQGRAEGRASIQNELRELLDVDRTGRNFHVNTTSY